MKAGRAPLYKGRSQNVKVATAIQIAGTKRWMTYSLPITPFVLCLPTRQVKCPECRAEHRIPYNGIQGFPTNYTLQKFLELHSEITGDKKILLANSDFTIYGVRGREHK